MEKFVPYEKLSKNKQRELNAMKRGSWGGINPVTRKPESPKAYNRRTAQRWKDDSNFEPSLNFIHFICNNWTWLRACYTAGEFFTGIQRRIGFAEMERIGRYFIRHSAVKKFFYKNKTSPFKDGIRPISTLVCRSKNWNMSFFCVWDFLVIASLISQICHMFLSSHDLLHRKALSSEQVQHAVKINRFADMKLILRLDHVVE